jgi:lipid A 3-O-deacylase
MLRFIKYYKIVLIQALIIIIGASASSASEFKFGFVQSPQRNERGLNVNLEYIGNELKGWRNPAPFIGLSKNVHGYTSSVYTGLVWKKVLNDLIYIEGSLGFAFHSGSLKRKKNSKVKGRIFGSRLLFRESLAMGYLFKNNNNITLFIDHISNANLVPPNHGLTNLGVRYGFAL